MEKHCCNSFTILTPTLNIQQDIFFKYLKGIGLGNLPFTLFKDQSVVKRIKKKGGARGPYRRYSSSEKFQIIQRLLQGQPLKKLAQRTMIPKRNLIRWKHDYIQDKKCNRMQVDSEEQSIDLDGVLFNVKKDTLETRQMLTTESMDFIRLQ